MDSLKEIKLGEELREKLLAGVNKLANTVCSTLGPEGSTVIIADGYGSPYITKDGVSVSNYIELEDHVENIAATLLKQVAQKTVEQAGDGTTTSISLAQAFINIGFKLQDTSTYNELKKELDDLEIEVTNYLKENSRELSNSDIINVATISANNDKEIGQLIQDAFDHSHIVKVEEGNHTSDKLITISGMELNTSYFDSAFTNNLDKQTAEYTEPLVILVDGKIDKLDNISRLLHLAKEQPIVLVADHISEQVLSILKDNYNRGALTIVPVKSPGFAGHRKNLMKDLGIYTGATLLDPNTKYTTLDVCGHLSNIVVGKDKTLFTEETNNTTVIEHLEHLKNALTTLEGESDKDLMTQRIENLTGEIAVIKVGGKSEVEMKERKDRIDDAVLAVNCALEEGIVEGGGKTLQLISFVSKNKFGPSLCQPKFTIVENGAIINYSEDFFKVGVIDPTKVTRVAVQNAISVAKTILGTKSIVLNRNLWK